MKSIIIDASIAVNWELADEKNAAANQILEEARQYLRLTPSIFWHEVRNIFLINEKRGRVTKEETAEFLKDLHALGIQEAGCESDASILDLARQYALSSYDAAYLSLAIKVHGILATNDRQLAKAALAAGVELRTALD